MTPDAHADADTVASTASGTGTGRSALRARAAEVVAARRQRLVDLARDIHARPELLFEERWAVAAVADALAAGGMEVRTGVYDLETALEARAGSGDLHVVICAEYDALPGVGHACGHNLIAGAAVGAGLALAAVADDIGLTVTVLGTPAEEGGGGKVLLLDRGAFGGAHAAMMIHPWPEDRLEMACLAVDHLEVRYHGRAAHASAAPHQGVNAADALVVAQVGLGLLRQHLHPGDQVHGIVTHGGDAPNIVPSATVGRFMLRATSLDELEVLRPRVRACFEAGALATGASVEVSSVAPIYSHMAQDEALLAVWRRNAEELGRRYPADGNAAPPTFSTDMANVSLAVPTIHPLIGIETHGAVNHQPQFAAACVGPSAEQALADGAVGMAWTAIDAATSPDLRAQLLARAS